MIKPLLSVLLLAISATAAHAQTYTWKKLAAAPYNGGKQDDLFFINADTGWSINGSGKIYRTNDGGSTWTNQLSQAGTYFRCVEFLDKNIGFAGTIGTDYFPGVTDTTALYKTLDGGINWTPVSYTGPRVKGLCAMSSVATPFINAGVLDTNYTIYAAGRVGGPAFLLKSTDAGATWTSTDLNAHIAMITDVKFLSRDTGFIFGGSSADITSSHTKIIYTTDGGATWTSVYESARGIELIWKGYFASRKVGYATVMSYNSASTQRYVAKTVDGGLSWTELPFTNDGNTEFGIGFVNEKTGWVGTDKDGFQTTDGGLSWAPKTMGVVANKIRLIPKPGGVVGYAIGLNVYKLDHDFGTAIPPAPVKYNFSVFPNPSAGTVNIRYHLDQREKICIEVYDMTGRKLDVLINAVQDAGDQEASFAFQRYGAGMLQLVFRSASGSSSYTLNMRP